MGNDLGIFTVHGIFLLQIDVDLLLQTRLLSFGIPQPFLHSFILWVSNES
jgi:hypothetical protein